MAHQAFALSPIAARATLPSEEDYDAIREAFMETARGRWFLDEYAKRNRNADTRMVLDAVSRIEDTLAAQRQPPPAVVIDRLPEALALIRRSLEKAEGAASGAFDRLRLEDNLAPIRKGARIIKEISWRWREIGADGRICDLIDSQVAAIETGCSQLAETDPRVALREAFESIRNEIEAFRHEAVASPPSAANVAPAPAPAPVRPLREVADVPAEIAAPPVPEPVEMRIVEPEVPVEPASAEAEPVEFSAEEADAQDEAVLEMVALEMAAPDPDEPEEPMVPVQETAHVTPPPHVEPLVLTHTPEPPTAIEQPEPPAPEPVLQPAFQPSPPVAPEPVTEPSLGSTLIASGFLRRPTIPANDPLAPIRRMSQAEKIAFFS